jgi:ATP-dependent RNA helicase DDX54/DBP10
MFSKSESFTLQTQEEDLIGFSSIPQEEDDEKIEENGKGKKKKSSGFSAMGLSDLTVKAIQKRGYKIPTAIQRKTIPVILEGRDIVAMAKTGLIAALI